MVALRDREVMKAFHRMWLVESPSPANSAPTTPILPTPALPLPSLASASPLAANFPASASLSVASMPGHLSGRLIGVVSLTDILNFIARSSGLSTVDPNEARRQRRRSSSSSVRASIDAGRSGSFDLRRP